MKRLILNADDFGMTAGINRAVLEAHRAGALTSATMIAAGNAVAEAAQLASATPLLGVGAHVVLLHGNPISGAGRVPSLLRFDGAFRPSFGSFARAALTGHIAAADVMIEVAAQVERLRATGLSLTHLDTHKHAHVFPAVFRPLLRAAAELGVRALRNPFEPEFSAAAALLATHGWARYAAVRGLSVFAEEFRREAQRAGVRTPDGTLGIAATARWHRPWMERLLRAIPEGTWELMCHPAYPDEAFHRFSSAGNAGKIELEILTAPWFRDAMVAAGIEPITFAEV